VGGGLPSNLPGKLPGKLPSAGLARMAGASPCRPTVTRLAPLPHEPRLDTGWGAPAAAADSLMRPAASWEWRDPQTPFDCAASKINIVRGGTQCSEDAQGARPSTAGRRHARRTSSLDSAPRVRAFVARDTIVAATREVLRALPECISLYHARL
jgi:hypothetical protein